MLTFYVILISQELAYRWLDKDIKKQLQHYPPSNSFLAKHIGTWRLRFLKDYCCSNGAMELIYSLLNTIKQREDCNSNTFFFDLL